MAAKDVTVCINDPNINNNPTYYYLPNTTTRLLCELGNTNVRPTLRDMYRSGWELVTIQQIDPAVVKNGKMPSPLMYFERAPRKRATTNQTRRSQPKSEPKRKQSSDGNSFFDDLL